MKTQNTKHKTQKLNFWLILGLFPFLFSCINEKDSGDEFLIEKVIDDNGFKIGSINSSKDNGIRVKNILELDAVLKTMNGRRPKSNEIDEILLRNGLEELPTLNFDSLNISKNEIREVFSLGKIQCIQNWRNIYGRIGIGGGIGSTYIDFGFTIGDGSGLISNWNSTLEGNTFMISLGKNDFRNNGYASPSNGYSYSGTYHFTIKLVLFFEGVGEIMTYQNQKVEIKVDGCSGEVSYYFPTE